MERDDDPEARRVARRAAAAGETVLWAGRPRFRFVPSINLMAAMGILGFLVWFWATKLIADPGMFRHWWQWGVPPMTFLAALPHMAPAVLEARRRRVVYAVTDRRVLILTPDGRMRHVVGLERSGDFRLPGSTIHLSDLDRAVAEGRRDLDGGLARFEALPKLERLGDPERVWRTIRTAAG